MSKLAKRVIVHCAQCRFLFQSEAGMDLQRHYECHRHPPQVNVVPGQSQMIILGHFPPTQLTNWCGEGNA